MPGAKIDLADFLSQQHLCESLTLKEVQTLLDFTDLEHFTSGDVIADIGTTGEALFFVIGGEVALVQEQEGGEVEIGRLHEGELAGNMSFFDHKPRSARLRATARDTRLLRLTRTRYNRLRVEHPFVAVNLLEHAIISLDHLFRRISTPPDPAD